MPLLKHNDVVTDHWTLIGADDVIPANGNIAVPFARLREDWDALQSRHGKLGTVFNNVDRAEALGAFLPRLSLIVLPFPTFNDGRSYSLARQFREFGYRGELRATGNVLPDQIQFMLNVGFDSFDIGERFPVETWKKAGRQMTLAYQRGLARPSREAEVWSERHTDAEPWAEQPYAG
jgi:uncharacterized protein (DUF934 family)